MDSSAAEYSSGRTDAQLITLQPVAHFVIWTSVVLWVVGLVSLGLPQYPS